LEQVFGQVLNDWLKLAKRAFNFVPPWHSIEAASKLKKYMFKILLISLILFVFSGLTQAEDNDSKMMDHSKMDHAAHMAMMANQQRQAEVSHRGKDVMPFKLAATTHIFNIDADGGVQLVAAKQYSDTG